MLLIEADISPHSRVDRSHSGFMGHLIEGAIRTVIIIVGAGLAGLTCAKVLTQAGRDVVVLDGADGVGGRVRSDRRDGYLFDRGFQVLFTAYPAVQRHLNLMDLDLKTFQPGAAIASGGKLYTITDPFRDRDLGHLAATVANPLISLGDKLRVARLRADVMGVKVAQIFGATSPDRSTFEELRARGFAQAGFIDQFIRPFYGGIFLDRDLHTSARMFLFIFKMLAEGDTVIPAAGMGTISAQLASHLTATKLQLGKRVTEVIVRNGRAAGVRLDDGSQLDADIVVLAVESPEATRLAGLDSPAIAKPVATNVVYFSSTASVYDGAQIVLNAATGATVNNVTQLTNVAPEYAPHGKHLLSVQVLGTPDVPDDVLYTRCEADLRRMFPAIPGNALTPLAIYRIPMAQFDQVPGIFAQLPANTTPTPGLFLAGEYTESSSIHGAMHSGEKAAQAILSASH